MADPCARVPCWYQIFSAGYIEDVLELALSPLPLSDEILNYSFDDRDGGLANWRHLHDYDHLVIEKQLWCHLCHRPVQKDEFPEELHLRLGI